MKHLQINKLSPINKAEIDNRVSETYQEKEAQNIKNDKLLVNNKNIINSDNSVKQDMRALLFKYKLLDDKLDNKIHILLFYKFQKIKNPEWFARKQKGFCKKIGVLGKVLIAKEGINGSISGTKEQVEKYKKFIHSQKGFEDVKFKEELGLKNPFTKMRVRIRNEIVSLKKKIDINKRGKYLSPKEFLEIYENNLVFNNDVDNWSGRDSRADNVIHRGLVSSSQGPQNKEIVNNNKINNKFNLASEVNQIRSEDQRRNSKNPNNDKLSEINKINNLTNKNDGFIILDARNYYEYELGRFKKALNPNIKTFREFPIFVEKLKKNFTKNERNR